MRDFQNSLFLKPYKVNVRNNLMSNASGMYGIITKYVTFLLSISTKEKRKCRTEILRNETIAKSSVKNLFIYSRSQVTSINGLCFIRVKLK
jgi:hypothetical protein